MTICPVIDPVQQRVSASPGAQSVSQGLALGASKVRQVDPPADIERGGARVYDKVRGRRCSHEADREFAHRRILHSPVVAFPQAGEELIGGEGEALYRV